MKLKKLIKTGAAVFISTTIVFNAALGFMGGTLEVKASNVDSNLYKATLPKAILGKLLKPYNVAPGDTVEVVIPVKASNYPIREPLVDVDLSKTAGFTLVSTPTVVNDKGNKVSNISVREVAYVKFSVNIPLNAKKGKYDDIPVKFITQDSFNEYYEAVLEQVSRLTFIISEQKKNAKFSLLDTEYPRRIKENQEVGVKLVFNNDGEIAANNVTVSIEGYENTLIPDTQPTETIGRVEGGATGEVEFNFTSIKNLQAGVTKLDAVVKYEYSDGSVAEPQKFTISMENIAKKTDTEKTVKKPIIQVSSVNYPHYTINAGDEFDVIYELKNIGEVDAKNISIDTTGYSEAGLKPKKAYDKYRKALVKAGESFTLKRSFIATETIQDGMKPITLNFNFYSVKDKAMANLIQDTMSIYIDTKGKESSGDVDNSMPRLTIAKYDTGKKKIKAGKTFKFTFDIMNPHSSVSADNIVVTISSADNNFAIVEGSASMFINSLAPGQVERRSIPLKAKGDIATNGYDLGITFDYEYKAKDVANKNALIKKQNKIEEKLKLQVYSDDRPMLANISVGGGETPVLNETTALSFDFNNMGKSVLYNVTAKVKGDFKSTNEILIIGNVNAGEGRSWSMDVNPQKYGMGKGVLTISYEDSNGNISSYDTDFESMVSETSPDQMPEIPTDDTPMPEGPKEVVPMWAFVCGNILIFIIGTVVTKNILIKKYKKKKLAEAMREDEEL